MTYSADARSGFYRHWVSIKSMFRLGLTSVVLWVSVSAAIAQTNITNQGGPIMRTAKVYLVFWLPSNSSFDGSVADGIGNYETLLTEFFNDVTPSTYYSILGQYTGTCSSNTCLVQNSHDAVRVGGTFVDTRAYAHNNGTPAAGSQTDPVLDADIQHEVQSLINQYGLSDGVNTEFLVYVGTGIQECIKAPATGAACTFFNPLNQSGLAFCAYHSSFTDSNGNDAVYAFLPVANGWVKAAMKGS